MTRAINTADAAVLRALLGTGDMGLAPSALAARCAMDPRRMQRAVQRLAAKGLVARRSARGAIMLTAGGTAQALSLAPPSDRAPRTATPAAAAADGRSVAAGALSGTPLAALDTAIAILPAEALRAFVRLMASTTVARYHLRAARASGWLAGIACGPTGTGKTLAARILCRSFGLDEATTIRLVESETERSLWGRREQDGGTWIIASAAVLDYPFVVLDEIDKAPSDLRTAVLKLLQGETRVPGEGDQVLAVAPAVLAITNGGPVSIRAEYRRRAVVVDTTPLLPVLGDLDQVARRILTPGTLAGIDLGTAVPPLAELDGDSLAVMRTLLRQVLSDAAWRECDRQGVELAALGRLALGCWDPETAALATVVDYAACAWTTGQVDATGLADLHQVIRDQAGQGSAGMADVLGALDAAAIERHRLTEEREQVCRAKAQAVAVTTSEQRAEMERQRLAVVGARAAVATSLRTSAASIERVMPAYEVQAAGARAQLRHLAKLAATARDAGELATLAELAREPMGSATALRGLTDGQREQQALQRSWAKAERRHAPRRRAPALPAAANSSARGLMIDQQLPAAFQPVKLVPMRVPAGMVSCPHCTIGLWESALADHIRICGSAQAREVWGNRS